MFFQRVEQLTSKSCNLPSETRATTAVQPAATDLLLLLPVLVVVVQQLVQLPVLLLDGESRKALRCS